MPFEFDLHGWFAGGTAADGLRTVPMAPPSQSTTTTEGQPRANWTGTAWVMRPYVAPPPEPEPQPVEVSRIVSVLGFRRRFTPAEKAAIEWAAVDRPDQPEELRRLLDCAHVAHDGSGRRGPARAAEARGGPGGLRGAPGDVAGGVRDAPQDRDWSEEAEDGQADPEMAG